MFSRWLLLVPVVLLGGCAKPDEPVLSDASVSATAPQADGSVEQVVTVNEGTNMSLDWHNGRLVISVQGVLFMLDDAGGTGRPITDQQQDAREPAFSPDGRSVIYHGYAAGNWDLWRISADGGAPQPLTSDAFDDREAAYSPAGDRVVFSSDRSGNYDIWSLDLADGSLSQLTFNPADEHSPAVSPDGESVAYVLNVSRLESEVHINSPDSSRIVISERGTVAGISWHHNGRGLSYQLWTIDSAGEPVTQLKSISLIDDSTVVVSADGADVFPFRASWLPDGSVIYAADGRIRRAESSVRTEIPFSVSFTLNRKPYQRRQRDHDSRDSQRVLGMVGPAVSPDGSRVVFSALADLWLWTPQTRSLQQLTDDAAAEQTPAWSADGSRISYISDKRGRSELWIHSFNGLEDELVAVGAGGVSYPSWSPDGSAIAVFAEIPGNPLGGQLTVIDLASGETRSVNRPMPAQPISWSPDGRHLAAAALAPYSSRYREGLYQLEVADLESDEVARILPVADQSMLDAVLTPDGRQMSFIQGGMLWRAQLDEQFAVLGSPSKLTDELTDNPSWSAGGEFVVYMSADRMKRLHVPTGEVDDITPDLSWSRNQPEQTWTLRAGRLFDGVSEVYRENVDLHIAGNRISSIEPASGELSDGDVDASDKTIIPGLFEMHAHMGPQSEAQGRTWLAYGVTTVRDPGSNPYLAKARQESWDSGRQIGPRTHVTGYLADGNRVYYSIAEGLISEAHLELALQRAKALQLDFIKTYVRLPDRWQARVVEFAHEQGIPVSSHELFPAVANGMDHVEHIGGTSRRGYQPKVSALGYSYADVIELLSQSGMGITPTAVLPGFAVVVADSPDYFETPQFETFYGAGARQAYIAMAGSFGAGGAAATAAANGRLLRTLSERDALLVTGTDSPFVPYGAGLHAELRLYALAGLTPYQVLRSASYKSALAAGVAADLGTLEVGMLADLVVVDGDPLADIRDADNVVMTVKNGQAFSLEQLLESSVNGPR